MEQQRELFALIGNELIPVHALTSDTHFGHTNIAKFTGRPFDNSDSTYEMDLALCKNWNGAVAANETTLHLGDVALGKIEESLQWIAKCNGRKILMPGNHDQISFKYNKNRHDKVQHLYDAVFDWIAPESGIQLKAVKDGEERYLQASHYPAFKDLAGAVGHDGKPMKDAFAALRLDTEILPLVHGHTHSHDIFQPDSPRNFNASVEAHNLAPLRADVVVDWVFSL